MIVTDWADINNLYTREYVAHDKKEAIEMAMKHTACCIVNTFLRYTTFTYEFFKQCTEIGKKNIVLEQGVTYPAEGAYYEENEPEIEKAVAAASGVDVMSYLNVV